MDIFPYELWERIAIKLNANDLMNLCKSFDDLLWLLRNKYVVTNFTLDGCYDIFIENLYQYIHENVGFQYIQSLNLNKLYWISLDEIRKILNLLPRLEELRAIDTELGMRPDDLGFYSKLRKLAVSVDIEQFISSHKVYKENLNSLKSLCIKIRTKHKMYMQHFYYKFFKEIRGLEELWFYDATNDETELIDYNFIVNNLPNLKKVVVKSKVPIIDFWLLNTNFLRVFDRYRNNYCVIICLVHPSLSKIHSPIKLSASKVFKSRTEKSWDVTQSLLSEIPCSYKNSLEIFQRNTFKDLEFDELSFINHRKIKCDRIFRNAVIDILLSKHCKGLKKLAITWCLLQSNTETQIISSLIFKKFNIFDNKNKHSNISDKENIFRNVVNNCCYLTDLEIVSCKSTTFNETKDDNSRIYCFRSTILGAYESISKFHYLKQLTIEIPKYSNGIFLKEIFQKCSDLESLQISCEDFNDNLNWVLYTYLNCVKKLQQLRLDLSEVDLNRLFSTLNSTTKSKLRRIFIKLKYEFSIQFQAVEDFMDQNNNNIIFLVICVENFRPEQFHDLEELLYQYKNHPAKIYKIKMHMDDIDDHRIYGTHKDILYGSSKISMLNFSDF